MKYRLTTVCTALVFAGVVIIHPALAQDKPATKESKSTNDKAAAAPGMEEMMKKMAEMAAPGPAHKTL